MNDIELIDRLCTVAATQAQIIKEQALFIEQQLAVDEEIKKNFADQRKTADLELGLLEAELHPFRTDASAERRV